MNFACLVKARYSKLLSCFFPHFALSEKRSEKISKEDVLFVEFFCSQFYFSSVVHQMHIIRSVMQENHIRESGKKSKKSNIRYWNLINSRSSHTIWIISKSNSVKLISCVKLCKKELIYDERQKKKTLKWKWFDMKKKINASIYVDWTDRNISINTL